MKKAACIALATLALLLVNSLSGHAASTYFPYEKIDSYFNQPPASPNPPQAQPAPSQPAPEEPVKAPPRREPPIMITQAPEFLFPEELGFGVAVGVPYDMVYISETYYYSLGGVWYRSASYKGPWSARGENQLPPELRKHKLSKIRALRNQEFRAYWKDKEHYKGKLFRPGMETIERPNGRKNGHKKPD
jgi:hypothetical protein